MSSLQSVGAQGKLILQPPPAVRSLMSKGGWASNSVLARLLL